MSDTKENKEWNNREVGALWVNIKQGKSEKYLTGHINDEKVIIFRNKFKEENAKAPEEAIEKIPRSRPTQTKGVTRRIRTGEGTLYITINEDENGLCEVFTTIGKAGGNAAAQSEAISRLISLSLRSGLDPKAIVRQLKGISGPNPTWEDGRLILSTPDAIGKALDDYLQERNTKNGVEDEKKNSDSPRITLAQEEKLGNTPEGMVCIECQNPSVFNEGGCLTCRECGWSKCD